MADLIVYLPNHGYSDDTALYVSWLDEVYYVSDAQTDSFKLATTSGGSELVEFTETITSGFVRQTDVSGGTTSITGLDHLEGENVYVTASGVNKGLYTVSGGSITVPSDIYIYCVGLPYTSTLQPMKLDIASLGLGTTKKVARAIVNLYKTQGGQYGPDADTLTDFEYDDETLFTGHKEVPIAGGYEREGNVIFKQDLPLPMTVLSLALELGAYAD